MAQGNNEADRLKALLGQVDAIDDPDKLKQAIHQMVRVTRDNIGHIGENVDPVYVNLLNARNRGFDTVVHESEVNRQLMGFESIFRNLALDEIDDNQEMADSLSKYDAARLETRFKENEALRALGTAIIDLQSVMIEALTKGKEFHAGALEEKKRNLVQLICKQFSTMGCIVSQADVRAAVIDDDKNALERLKQSMKGLEPRTIERILTHFTQHQVLLKSLKSVQKTQKADVAISCMKAASAVNAELTDYKRGWLNDLRQKHRGSFIDLSLDDGSDYHIYINGQGNVNVLTYKVSESYATKADAGKILHYLQDPKVVTVPTASIVYAHVYDEKEVKDAFAKIPDGAVLYAPILIESEHAFARNGNGHQHEIRFVKKNGKIEYYVSELPEGAPTIENIRKSPCRWMNVTRLRFSFSETKTNGATHA